MSDMLDKLLGVEKTAAEIVAAAEIEADARKARARAEGQKRHAELLKEKAAEAERAVEAQRESAARERRQKNEAYRAELARRSENRPELVRTVTKFLSKGGA